MQWNLQIQGVAVEKSPIERRKKRNVNAFQRAVTYFDNWTEETVKDKNLTSS